MRLSCDFVNVYMTAYRIHVYTRASLIYIHQIRIQIRLIEYTLGCCFFAWAVLAPPLWGASGGGRGLQMGASHRKKIVGCTSMYKMLFSDFFFSFPRCQPEGAFLQTLQV